MEELNKIILPEFSKKTQEEKKKPLKKIPNSRERLGKTNREVKCSYCQTLKILNPSQYQSLFDFYGSEEKVEENYMCKPCDMDAKENPIKFWSLHGDFWNPLLKDLKDLFDAFNESNKSRNDFVTLQQIVAKKLLSVHIASEFTLLLERDNTARGIQLKKFPFIGTLNLKIYEQKEKRIQIVA